MSDPKADARQTLEEFVEQQGYDPHDPKVQSVLSEKLGEFDEWWDGRPDWVSAGDDLYVDISHD